MDFDLAGIVGAPYPDNYCSSAHIWERHPRALPGTKRAKVHDLHAVEAILNDSFPAIVKSIPTLCSMGSIEEMIRAITQVVTLNESLFRVN